MIEQLEEGKFKFILHLQKFNNICYEINLILSKHNYFLRIFELKDKYRQLSMKEPKKQNIARQLSSILIEKYNGFQVISTEFDRKQNKNFKPIDIIYKPTKHPEFEPICYYSNDIAKAYTNFYSVKNKNKRALVVANVTIAENYSSDMKDLQSYYKTFQKFIDISIGLMSMLNHYNKNDTVNYEVQQFIQDIFNDDSIDDIKNHIMKTEIKNAISTSYKKVPDLI